MNPEYDLTVEAIAAMGDLICRFSFPVLEEHLGKPAVFVQLSPFLRRIKGCPMTCLRDLARIAVKVEAYGNPSTWTPEVVSALGVVIAGETFVPNILCLLKNCSNNILNFTGLDIEHWKHFSSNIGSPLSGIQMATVKCIPNNILKVS